MSFKELKELYETHECIKDCQICKDYEWLFIGSENDPYNEYMENQING